MLHPGESAWTPGVFKLKGRSLDLQRALDETCHQALLGQGFIMSKIAYRLWHGGLMIRLLKSWKVLP
jgi:hypothetical protein